MTSEDRGRIARSLAVLRGVRNAAHSLRRPLYVPAGHFYSPLTTADDAARAELWSRSGVAPGVRLDPEAQVELARRLAPMWSETPVDGRYQSPNPMYPLSDAAVYSSMLREFRPKRVVEVGSGWSSAVALDTADRHGLTCEWTWIEPYPQRLLGLLSQADLERSTLVRSPVQDTPLDLFDALRAGDVLVIDSTHVAKAGSDVVWLFLRVLPRLAPGVLVHVHDVFWPFEYPAEWLREGRDWTEDYLLHAFLAFNDSWRILLFSDWLWQHRPEFVAEHLPRAAGERPGSIWIQRAG